MTYKVSVHVGGLQRPSGALGKSQMFYYVLGSRTVEGVDTNNDKYSPVGQREPRTWAEGGRGTEPSPPSLPEQSGVSAREKNNNIS